MKAPSLNLFTTVLFAVSSLSLLASRDFPNGLFSLKELAFYFFAGTVSIGVALAQIFRKNATKPLSFSLTDILVFLYLVAHPLCQYLFRGISLPNLLVPIGCFAMYYALKYFAREADWKPMAKRFSAVLFIVLGLNTLVCLAQYAGLLHPYHHASSISGMFFNPGPFAVYFASLTVFLFVLAGKAILGKDKRTLIWIGAALAICLFILSESNSRSAWVGLGAGFLFVTGCYLASHCKTNPFRKKKYLIPAFAIGLTTIMPVGYWLYHIRPDSADGRILIWKTTWNMIADHPATGIGPGKFPAVYPEYQAKNLKDSVMSEKYGILAGETEHAFNDLLFVLAEEGIVGLLLFAGILVLCFRRLYLFGLYGRKDPWIFAISVGLMASLIALLAGGMTSYPMQMLPVSVWFWVLVACMDSVTKSKTAKGIKINPGFVPIFIFPLLGVAFYFYGSNRLYGYTLWQEMKGTGIVRAEMLAKTRYMENEGEFHNALGHHYADKKQDEEAVFHYEKAVSYTFDKEYYYDLAKFHEKTGNYAEALAIYGKVESAIPYLVKPKYLQAKLYYVLEMNTAFEKKAIEVIEATPKVYNNSVDLMKKEIKHLYKTKKPVL